MTDGIPPLRPLGSIIDQMRDIAREEIPAHRSCHIKLWDDGTFEGYIYYSARDSENQAIRYERTIELGHTYL